MMQDDKSNSNNKNNEVKKPSFLRILMSTSAAAFGVQNKKNLEQDFTHGNIKVFITAGVLFTGIFIVAVILIVKTVLKASGV